MSIFGINLTDQQNNPSRTMWKTEQEVRSPGLTLQVGSYDWPTQFEAVEATQRDTATMMLSPRRPRTKATYCAGGMGNRFVEVGRVSFAPASVPMHWHTEGGSLRSLRCQFDEGRVQGSQRFDQPWSVPELEASLDMSCTGLDYIMSRLLAELDAPGFAAPTMIEALGVELTIELSRYFRRVREIDGSTRGNIPIEKLTDYIDALPSRSPSIQELAELCGMSRGHLMRLFKARTGMPLHAYIERVRFVRAKSLLTGTNLPLKEIAYRLGFANQANFSVAFRKMAGLPPGALRSERRRR